MDHIPNVQNVGHDTQASGSLHCTPPPHVAPGVSQLLCRPLPPHPPQHTHTRTHAPTIDLDQERQVIRKPWH